MGSERLKLPVRGLKSAACVSELENVMRQQEGVIWATVNLAAEEAVIVYDPAGFDLVKLAKAAGEQGCVVVLGISEIASLRSTLPIRGRRLQPKFLGRTLR